MTDRICSIPDCGRRHKGRGFCEAHLDRWKRHGDPLHGGPVVTKGIHAECTVPGCDRPYKGRGYCEPHLERWKKYGDPAQGGPIRTRGLLAECTVDGCHGPIKGNGYCSMHWQKDRKYGDPLGGTEYSWTKGEFAQWLIDQPDTADCIEPRGFTSRPVLRLDGVMHNASRSAWILHHGDPGKQFVLHTCDNEMCVNIQHLYLGDQGRNMRDAVERGRKPKAHPVYGEAHPSAKLTEDSVREIRRLYTEEAVLPVRMAEAYNVNLSTIVNVIRRKTWKHIA